VLGELQMVLRRIFTPLEAPPVRNTLLGSEGWPSLPKSGVALVSMGIAGGLVWGRGSAGAEDGGGVVYSR